MSADLIQYLILIIYGLVQALVIVLGIKRIRLNSNSRNPWTNANMKPGSSKQCIKNMRAITGLETQVKDLQEDIKEAKRDINHKIDRLEIKVNGMRK